MSLSEVKLINFIFGKFFNLNFLMLKLKNWKQKVELISFGF